MASLQTTKNEMVLIAVNLKPAATVAAVFFFLSFQFRQIEGKRETTRNGNLISALFYK
jgi:hypothetical protein